MKISEDTGMPEFEVFPKIPRLYKGNIVVTEKIDGTNGQIYLEEYPIDINAGTLNLTFPKAEGAIAIKDVNGSNWLMYVGSRSRWLGTGQDNFGFFAWAWENARYLAELGPGHHYGEWWGKGIQRGYGQSRKRFSLFNVSRWFTPGGPGQMYEVDDDEDGPEAIPVIEGLSTVPVLYHGPWFGRAADPVSEAMRRLQYSGSSLDSNTLAEGVMVYHQASGYYLKAPFEREPKGAV